MFGITIRFPFLLGSCVQVPFITSILLFICFCFVEILVCGRMGKMEFGMGDGGGYGDCGVIRGSTRFIFFNGLTLWIWLYARDRPVSNYIPVSSLDACLFFKLSDCINKRLNKCKT